MKLICISAVLGACFWFFPSAFLSCSEATSSSLTGNPCPLLCSQPLTGVRSLSEGAPAADQSISQSITQPIHHLTYSWDKAEKARAGLNEFVLWMGTKLETPRLSPALPQGG